MERVDVLVVGAGPAGTSTAIHLARSGANVLVAEKARFPRDKPCGGGLTGRALKRIPVDPSAVVERDVDRFELRLRYGSSFARSHDEPLIRMTQRRRLDAFLAEQAAEAGAEVREGARVERLESDENGVTALVDGTPVRADVVVGADGANGVVARSFGLGDASSAVSRSRGTSRSTRSRAISRARRSSSSQSCRADTAGCSRRAIMPTSASAGGAARGLRCATTSHGSPASMAWIPVI